MNDDNKKIESESLKEHLKKYPIKRAVVAFFLYTFSSFTLQNSFDTAIFSAILTLLLLNVASLGLGFIISMIFAKPYFKYFYPILNFVHYYIYLIFFSSVFIRLYIKIAG